MTPNSKSLDERKTDGKVAGRTDQPGRDDTVAGSGDNRRAGDQDGNRSADGAKSPGADNPETKSK